ncbi:MAG: dTDP-4-dehydrorhamnose reductase [Deltaproteobacteria bacterium]|nr:dTDP-4-dehydrorhamnose reductase [Deltaproteobacteria bacterium]
MNSVITDKQRKSVKPTLLLIGVRGQLGYDCAKVFSPYFSVSSLNSSELDLSHTDKIMAKVIKYQPDVIVNCAAYTKVDNCESDIETAHLINAEAPARLAAAAKECNALLVHISTDYVFSGDRALPNGYSETDKVNPVSVYGASKLAGEEAIVLSGCEHLIVRTAWLYGINGHNFLKTMLRLVLSEPDKERKVVADQFGCLTWSLRLAQQLLKLIKADKRGLYHGVGEGSANWYEVASCFLQLMRVEYRLTPCTTAEYPTPARRPANSILLNRRLKEDDLLLMRPWQDDLGEFVDNYRESLLKEALKAV